MKSQFCCASRGRLWAPHPPAADGPLSAAGHDEAPDTFQHFNNKWADREWWWCSMGSVISSNDGLFSESSESVSRRGGGIRHQTSGGASGGGARPSPSSNAFLSVFCFPSIRTPLKVSNLLFAAVALGGRPGFTSDNRNPREKTNTTRFYQRWPEELRRSDSNDLRPHFSHHLTGHYSLDWAPSISR